MQLYLMRHGEAKSAHEDPNRGLTVGGHADVERIAKKLKSMPVAADTILHSSKQRALETADVIHGIALPQSRLEQKQGILPNDSPQAAVEWVAQLSTPTMIVSHLPFLPALAALLLGEAVKHETFGFPPAGVLCLSAPDSDQASHPWRYEWSLTPDQC